MTGIGLQRDGTIFFAGLEQAAGDRKVDHRCQNRLGETDPDLLQALRCGETRQRRPNDACCGKQDQRSLYAAGKVFGFAITKRVHLIRGTGGNRQHGESHRRGGEVDERFQRVGEESHRACDEVGRRFERDRRYGSGDGKPGKLSEIPGCHDASLTTRSSDNTQSNIRHQIDEDDTDLEKRHASVVNAGRLLH
jgi:hypothetical protein